MLPSPILREIRDAVMSEFPVREFFVEQSVPVFVIEPCDTKQRFLRLYNRLYVRGYMPTLRREGERIVLRVYPRIIRDLRGGNLPLILLLITIGTVALSGYILGSSPSMILFRIINPAHPSPFLFALIYTASVLSIIAFHELSHYSVSRYHGITVSKPHFIPGPPPIGTFGAIIFQTEPAVNRDQLFDIGLSGPVGGFIATIGVAIIVVALSATVTPLTAQTLVLSGAAAASYFPNEPLLLILITDIVRSLAASPNQPVFISPLHFAAWIGCVITFLNILPVWQLDGGHVIRAVAGSRGHRIASIAGLIVMVVAGFWLMALIIFLLSYRRPEHPGPLDDVSPLSKSRKALLVVYALMLTLCFLVLHTWF